jgi:tripartite-type tricarboxylate transporter receptor subunit TctC
MNIIIAFILSIIATFAHAELPSVLSVYIKGATGSQYTICRKLFEEYDLKYNTTTVMRVIPGAGGLLATKQFINSTEPLPLMCGGISEFSFNTREYPVNKEYVAQFKTVSILASGPYFFTTRADSPYSTVWMLKQSGKHIFIGSQSPTLAAAAKVVFGEKNVTYVNYKSPNDAISSLLDGSVDVYVSGGALTALTESGKMKDIGRTLGGFSKISLDKEYPDLVTLSLITSIHSLKTLSDSDTIELNKRIEFIMSSPAMKPALEQFNNLHTPNTVAEATRIVKTITSFVDNLK